MKRLSAITALVALTMCACLCVTASAKLDQTLRIGVVQSLFRYASQAEAKSSMGQFEAFMKNYQNSLQR